MNPMGIWATGKDVIMGGWREFVFLKRRGLVLVAAVCALAGMAFEDTRWVTDKPWWIWVQLCAVGLIVYGEGFRLWATWHIGGRKSATVVDTGPYAWSRNPLYVGSLICVLGIGVLGGSLIAATVGVAALGFIYGATIRHEEAYLLRTLGEPYAEYFKRVPRFFPSRGANAATRNAVLRAERARGLAGGSGGAGAADGGEVASGGDHRPSRRLIFRELYTGFGFLVAGAAAVAARFGVEHLQAEGVLPVVFSMGWFWGG